MNPPKPVYDVMRRTMHNLRFIEAYKKQNGPYEVTQLVNSFLGALAHPWEKNKKLKKWLASDSATRRLPMIQKELASDIEPKNDNELLRLMRNAFAHGNIEYLPNNEDEIYAIRFWNENLEKPPKRTWGAVLTVTDLRRFLDCFVALAEDIEPK